ncbi:MAG: mechanosensitive ion channel protein [Flammeovirgaceae bacterium]|nr:mechanosensitive ion channel protein [Flammeovirgaceae bacterium]MBR10282.1 mechanosensitive ion channel protein [Rickettsiales bacterium]HCX22921.1 mechanosensitive ion channel protein [Cytophagales bacterium]
MSKQLLFISLCFISFFGRGQDSLFVDLSSPYGSLRTHLFYLQDDHYDAEKAAQPFLQKGISQEQAIKAAIQLKQAWDGEGTFITMEAIPKNPNFKDSLRNRHIYVIDNHQPAIILVKNGNEWIYAKSSLDAIQDFHDEVFPFGTDKLLQLLPKIGTRKIMGLYLYQYIGILILALLSVLIHKIFSVLFEEIITRLLLKAGYERLADHFMLPVARPISLFVVILLLRVFLPVLQLPPDTSHWAMLLLKALLPLFGTIVFYRLVDVLAMYLENLAKKTESTLDDQLVPLLRKTLKTFVVGIGTLFILENLDIPIIPLLTGLSIGGLAFALAAQDTIKNFFGSLMIFIDRPFQIGDWITSGDIDGSVEEVGFRSSRIRTFRNSLMYVPNGKLADSVIDNHGMRQYRRFYTQIAVTYDTPPELIDTFVEGLRKIVETHPDTRKDYYNVYFNDMAAFSLNIMFYIFFEVPDWGAELKARHEVLMQVLKLGNELGVNFAFPTQTLHMENFPGKPSLSPSYTSQEEANQKITTFFENQK